MAGSIKQYVKMGFGVGVGVIAAQLIYLAIGMILLLIGLRMLASARKNNTSTVPAYVVMLLGALFAFGLGFGIIADSISNS
jgi:hypothetical protein